MPILIDLSQHMISNVMASPDIRNQIDVNMIRHMIINSLMSIKKKFSAEYGDIVICCDSKNGYWRREVFPHYKAGRKKARDEDSFINWNELFQCINQIEQDLIEYFPYKVLRIDGAEADDVIGILALFATEKTLIIGSDKDYIQCQRNPFVKQYSNIAKTFINPPCFERALFEHIIKGDKGDGIPNIKSPSDSFVQEVKTRQKSIYEKEISAWFEEYTTFGIFPESAFEERFAENKKLIDFTEIPDNIKQQIKDAYATVVPKGNKTTVFDYFVANKMRNLLSSVNDV